MRWYSVYNINTPTAIGVLPNVTEVCAADCGLNNKRSTASSAAVHFYLQHDHMSLSIHELPSTDNWRSSLL